MSSITSRFVNGRKAFIPYLMAGYPDRPTFLSLVDTLFDSGADAIEIGIPFSDPLADGPTIQHASEHALANGVTIATTIEMLGTRHVNDSQPLIVMSYLNPLMQYGLPRFLREAHTVGVRGLIVPDVIVEECAALERDCRKAGIDLIYLLAPTSPKDRQQLILNRSRGFVYIVSVTGVTGARRELSDSLTTWIASVKSHSTLPLAVGFGIATPEHAFRVANVADGVVVGSALIDIIRRAESRQTAVQQVAAFASSIRAALDRITQPEQSPLSPRQA